MSQDGHSVAVLSGDLTVEQRLERTFCPGVSTSNRLPLSSTSTCRWISRDEPIAKRIYIELDAPNGITINLVGSDRSMMICRSTEKHFRKKIQLLDAENSDEIEKIAP
ncbi:DEAD-box helicase Dbp80-like isoform X2 [Topomyia yanbarensis]|uniref:DEAD-box helicase Dbp80-like isoform X2 n=1 Tax=Topomyia yanbarensis TaxID=2498891 RepID=UPI00273C1A2B|nr:DEAD-box helicase Dbp80-like isoform X2 [Topomyia yanbarensis]